jgi:hypothetical protein
MGRRSRQRARGAGTPVSAAPVSGYADGQGGELRLRGVLTAATRERYRATLAGGLEREDAWQRASELLFEHLAVAWTINDVQTSGQRELLARYRAASQAERAFVRDSLRAHLAEHFPELPAP